MRSFIRAVAVVSAVMFVVPVASVQAAPPLGVSFEVPTTITETGPTFGPFTASGNAVDAGLICPAGDTIDVGARVTAYQSQAGVNFQVAKEFTCADGSGSFLVKLQVRIDRRGDNFVWTIMDGTGDYAGLRGSGSGYGEPMTDGVIDHYVGILH